MSHFICTKIARIRAPYGWSAASLAQQTSHAASGTSPVIIDKE
jgi:hypothetical protein